MVEISDPSARGWHRLAMRFAEGGWFTRAYRCEGLAAMECADALTRSVLYRSAATLALDAGETQEARRLAECGLAGAPPAEIADELREVLVQCNDAKVRVGSHYADTDTRDGAAWRNW